MEERNVLSSAIRSALGSAYVMQVLPCTHARGSRPYVSSGMVYLLYLCTDDPIMGDSSSLLQFLLLGHPQRFHPERPRPGMLLMVCPVPTACPGPRWAPSGAVIKDK